MRRSIDKRNFPRIKTPRLTIEYKTRGTGSVNRVNLIDISAGGISFLRNSVVNKRDMLIIKFPFKSQKMLLNGEVVRVDGREVGVQFMDNDSAIDKFVELFNKEYSYLIEAALKKDSNSMPSHRKDGKTDKNGINDALDLDNE